MFKSIILTVAMMTAPFVADAQWSVDSRNFKKVNEHTRVMRNYSKQRIRVMLTIVLTNNNYILDTMIFNSKSPVPFFQSWETKHHVKTMAVVENDNNKYDIYLFHHRREETFYFRVNGLNYGYLP